MPEFVQVDWNEKLDVEALRAGMNADSKVRGIFFDSAIKLAKAKTGQNIGRERYSLLRNYPAIELADVLLECAQLVYPDVSLRMGLRQLGQQVFPELLKISAAPFLFSVAGRDVEKIFKLIKRAYDLFSSGATTALREEEDGLIIVMRNHWLFADSYHFGIFEGALAHHGAQAKMSVRRYSLCDVDIKLELQ